MPHAPYLWEAKKHLDEGKLGKIHLCRVFNMKHLDNFKIDPNRESFTNSPAGNAMLRREYRKPWVVTEEV